MTEGKFTETLHGNIKYGGEVDLGTSPIYFSGERLLISNISGLTFNMIRNKVPLQSTLINFGALFEKARIIIPSFYVPFLKVTYKFESGEDRIYHSPSEFVPMRASATGYQATLPMILVIENYHKEKANLRVIRKECNLSRTGLGRLKRSTRDLFIE